MTPYKAAVNPIKLNTIIPLSKKRCSRYNRSQHSHGALVPVHPDVIFSFKENWKAIVYLQTCVRGRYAGVEGTKEMCVLQQEVLFLFYEGAYLKLLLEKSNLVANVGRFQGHFFLVCLAQTFRHNLSQFSVYLFQKLDFRIPIVILKSKRLFY